LAAVGVEDAVAEVHAGAAGRHHQDLVAAHAQVPVGNALQLGARERERRFRAVDDDEVVSRPVHLGERELHLRAASTRAQMRSIEASSMSGLMGSESTLPAAASAAGSEAPGLED